GTVHDLARQVLDIASAGLTRRKRLNSAGDNESGFLEPLGEIVASGKTPAERLLDLYHGPWQADVSHVYSEFSF
ncbi:MAG TPA: glutamate--cysteine ligase, partial [Sphingomicrobium sp.]|nr:glutamate--cysteine ligase [Sphingomicrobium sp.]